MVQSIKNKIELTIKQKGRGKIIFTKDFSLLGTEFVIRQSLSRLCKEGLILRLSAGAYLYPKISKLIGTVYPSINEIIEQIAKREKSRIVPTGLYALNKIGLSTQVPMRFVFLTDGAARELTIAGVKVKFQKTIAKNLAFKGKLTILVVFALKEIGKNNLQANELHKINELLSHEPKDVIIHDSRLAPNWIAEIMLNTLKIKTDE
jgi:predicted transcriptional regulator of viral defense system